MDASSPQILACIRCFNKNRKQNVNSNYGIRDQVCDRLDDFIQKWGLSDDAANDFLGTISDIAPQLRAVKKLPTNIQSLKGTPEASDSAM